MEFFLIVVVGIFVMVLLTPKHGGPVKKINTGSRGDLPDDCPPHRWEYDDTGFLICKDCNGRPGYSGRE